MPSKDSAAARSVTRIVAFAESRSANVIGITSDRLCTGVSVTARLLATAYENFGKRALLIDISNVELSDAVELRDRHALDLRASLEIDCGNVAHVDLGALSLRKDIAQSAFRKGLEARAQEFDAVILDLPPVSRTDHQPSPTLLSLGPVCDLVFLVCLTGVITRARLSECAEICRIGGINLGGLILCDRKLTANGLLKDNTWRGDAAAPPGA